MKLKEPKDVVFYPCYLSLLPHFRHAAHMKFMKVMTVTIPPTYIYI